MTTRKPAKVSFPDWIEGQITRAQRDGAFDQLPGKGKPIPGIDQPQHELQWVADYLRRERVEVAAILPPQLALAKAVEDLPQALAAMSSETRARATVHELNERIRAAHRAPQHGPPLRVRTVDVEAALDQWRAARAARAAALEAARTPVQAQPAPRRRRWWRRS
jgi:hypothetical protein